MFRTYYWRLFLTFFTAVIVASALLAMPVAASPHPDCSSSNLTNIDGHSQGMAATTVGCCAASYCCPVLPHDFALDVPTTSQAATSSVVQLDQPLLLVRSLHPPPRALVI